MKKFFNFFIIIAIALLFIQKLHVPEKIAVFGDGQAAKHKISAFAKENNIPETAWPKEFVELLTNNPEAEEFVLNYPLKKNIPSDIVMENQKNSDTVPLYMQWDTRWGYIPYGDTVLGLSGCGPVCLSMVCTYLFNDTSYHPGYMAEFSAENGYCVPGSGSSWSLISEGGQKLGLTITEIPLDKNRIIKNLNVKNPIICVMGPGDFTTDGHFIVLCGTENGKLKINDPNSIKNSEKLWEFDDIKNQILNLWVCRVLP